MKSKLKYIGTVKTIQFIRKHHGMFRLPPEELFAMVRDEGTEDELYVLVSEADPTLEVVGCRYADELHLHGRACDRLAAQVAEQARECTILPPYSVTVANRSGVFSYPQLGARKRQWPDGSG